MPRTRNSPWRSYELTKHISKNTKPVINYSVRNNVVTMRRFYPNTIPAFVLSPLTKNIALCFSTSSLYTFVTLNRNVILIFGGTQTLKEIWLSQ